MLKSELYIVYTKQREEIKRLNQLIRLPNTSEQYKYRIALSKILEFLHYRLDQSDIDLNDNISINNYSLRDYQIRLCRQIKDIDFTYSPPKDEGDQDTYCT